MTQEEINKKYKNRYVSFSKTYDYSKQEYIYTVHKTYKDIHENTSLGQDIGTKLEYTR